VTRVVVTGRQVTLFAGGAWLMTAVDKEKAVSVVLDCRDSAVATMLTVRHFGQQVLSWWFDEGDAKANRAQALQTARAFVDDLVDPDEMAEAAER
jgi:hypothetical protein